MRHAFWKDNIEDRVELLESNVFNKIVVLRSHLADLCKIGRKMRE